MALRGDLEPCGFGTSLTPSRCPPCGEERILATPGIRDRRGRVDLPDPARAGAPASRRARHWRRASQRRGCRRLRDAQRGGHGIRTPRGFLEDTILPGANYQTKPMRRPACPPSMPRRRPRRRTGQCARCQRPANGSGRHKGYPHAARQGHLFRGGPSRTRESPDRPATKWSKEAEARILRRARPTSGATSIEREPTERLRRSCGVAARKLVALRARWSRQTARQLLQVPFLMYTCGRPGQRQTRREVGAQSLRAFPLRTGGRVAEGRSPTQTIRFSRRASAL